MTAMPAAGSPSVRANWTATAGPCPASAATTSAPGRAEPGLGAGTASPAIQDSCEAEAGQARRRSAAAGAAPVPRGEVVRGEVVRGEVVVSRAIKLIVITTS